MGHLSWQCYQNPKRLQQTAIKVAKGKRTKLWIETRNKWFKENKADHYICYLCGKWLTRFETTLDHIKPRGSNPGLRLDFNNLATCCFECNQKKGSQSLENYLLKRGGGK